MLICPVCGKPLAMEACSFRCERGHSFDKAKEGYVNLLRSSKSGDRIGDDKQAARCRRDLLNKGYYASLKDALLELFRDREGNLLDICCGEGYYTSALARLSGLQVWGFDISKEMVRLASKRGGAQYFVANMVAIPVQDESLDFCTHLFAPFHEKEFYRVLKPGGRLYTVVPGRLHLWGLKRVLYDTPYENDEALPQTSQLRLAAVRKVSATILLESPEDIEAVFHMTPYYFRTSDADKQKLVGLRTLETPVEFVIGEYEK